MAYFENPKFVYFLGLALPPVAFLIIHGKGNTYSSCYKQQVIKKFFGEYLTNVELFPKMPIDTQLIHESLLLNPSKVKFATEDYITAICNTKTIKLCEIITSVVNYKTLEQTLAIKGFFMTSELINPSNNSVLFLK